MRMCEDCEIVYDSRSCPLCEAKVEIKALEDEIYELKKEIKEMES